MRPGHANIMRSNANFGERFWVRLYFFRLLLTSLHRVRHQLPPNSLSHSCSLNFGMHKTVEPSKNPCYRVTHTRSRSWPPPSRVFSFPNSIHKLCGCSCLFGLFLLQLSTTNDCIANILLRVRAMNIMVFSAKWQRTTRRTEKQHIFCSCS